MSDFNIFFSWQADRPSRSNRNLIQSALEKVAKRVSEAENVFVNPVVDRDTIGRPGSPDIGATIFAKIESSQLFVADVTFIGDVQGKAIPNPNVLVELGYALKCLGEERVIMVLNDYFGAPEQLPFDLKMKRVTRYTSAPKDEERVSARTHLAKCFEESIRLLAANHIVTTDDLSWRLPEETFSAMVIEAFRADDDISARRMLSKAVKDASQFYSSGEHDRITVILDRVTSFAAIALQYDRGSFSDMGIEALQKLYNLGFDGYGTASSLTKSPEFWRQIAVRLFALGGLAIRTKQWGYIRRFVERPRTDGDFATEVSWLRHASMQAARVEAIHNSSLISLATDYTQHHPQFESEDEDANLTSICQFDFAACLVATEQPQFDTMDLCYPEFAHFQTHRIVPFIRTLISNQAVRDQLVNLSDAELAYALHLLNQLAVKKGFRCNGWTQIRNDTICSFINDLQHKTAYTRAKLLRQLYVAGQGNSAYFDPGPQTDDNRILGVYPELRRMKAEGLVEGSISADDVLASVRLTSAGDRAAEKAQTSLLLRVRDELATVANSY